MAMGFGFRNNNNQNRQTPEQPPIQQPGQQTGQFRQPQQFQQQPSGSPASFPTNYAEVEKLISTAASWNLDAGLELYRIYNTPGSPFKEEPRAFFWLRYCADIGDANCCILVGDAYRTGTTVVSKNLRTAFKFYELANRKQHVEARSRMQLIYNEYVPNYYDDNYFVQLRAADEYDPIQTESLISAIIAWRNGDAARAEAIGSMYASAQGVKRDYLLAFYFFDILCRSDYKSSFYQQARLLALGAGVFMDLSRAISFFEQSQPDEYSLEYLRENVQYGNDLLEAKFDQCSLYDSVSSYWAKLGAFRGSPYLCAQYGLQQITPKYHEQNPDEAKYFLSVALVCGGNNPKIAPFYGILLSKIAIEGKLSENFLDYLYNKARQLFPDRYQIEGTYRNYFEWERNVFFKAQNAAWFVDRNITGDLCDFDPQKALENLRYVEDPDTRHIYRAKLARLGAYGPAGNIDFVCRELRQIQDYDTRLQMIDALITDECNYLILAAYYPAIYNMYESFLGMAMRNDYDNFRAVIIEGLGHLQTENIPQLIADTERIVSRQRETVRTYRSTHPLPEIPEDTPIMPAPMASAPAEIPTETAPETSLDTPIDAPMDIVVQVEGEDGGDEELICKGGTDFFRKQGEAFALCEKYGNWEGEPETEAANVQGQRDPIFAELQRLTEQGDAGAILTKAFELSAEFDGDPDKTYKYILPYFKEAALRNHPLALLFLLDTLLRPDKDGATVNTNLCLRLLPVCEEMIQVPNESADFPGLETSFEEVRKGIDEFLEEYSLADRYEYIKKHAYELEQNHDTFQEWMLYEEFAHTAKAWFGTSVCPFPFIPSHPHKYAASRIDWAELLDRPWNEYWKNCDFSLIFDTGVPLKSLLSSVLKHGETKSAQLPENLDSYFEGMIGMEPVKAQLDKIYQSVKLQILREKILREKGEDPGTSAKGYNFILLGNPGTGKTTVARIIAKILFDIGVRSSDSFSEVERSKIISDHVGGTEKRMRGILDQIQGGTLFIDEAYALYREDSDNDFGREAIDVLMKDMEDRRNSYSVIIAGYREPMLNMIKNANSGFSSRFTYQIELPDYSDEALIEMAHAEMTKQKFTPAEGVEDAIKKAIHHDKIDQTFGNARYIRELVNRAVENQSHRLHEADTFNPDDLFILQPQDFFTDASEQKSVKEYLEDLNALTGLASVKEEVNSLISVITVQKEMEKRGMGVAQGMGTLHMAFKGNPGTGKTTVARIIGNIYTALGILKRDDVFVECSRSDLVAEYQGQTAVKVKKVVQSAMGGILFVDEAYSLVQSENDTFGREAVDMLVSEMENNRDNLVVIFAGYSHDIDKFFENNQGLRSRVPKDLIFEDYSLNELFEIAMGMFKSKKLVCTEDAAEVFRMRLLQETSCNPNFGNARGVRNIIDSVIRKQNVRIAKLMMENAAFDDSVLLTIEKEDITK